MYQRIKQLADDAVKLQNKDRMDAALREISALTIAQMEAEAAPKAMDAEQFEATEKAQHEARNGVTLSHADSGEPLTEKKLEDALVTAVNATKPKKAVATKKAVKK